MKFSRILALCLCALSPLAAAHVGNHPSVHDTVAGIVQRLRTEKTAEELTGLNLDELLAFLTDEEKHILATEHITFTVNVPATLYVFRDAGQNERPFWLDSENFDKTDMTATVDEDTFEVWAKKFPAGSVGTGVNSLTGDGDHYFLAVVPQSGSDELVISNMYPGRHTVGTLALEDNPYIEDWGHRIKALPEALAGKTIVRGDMNRRKDAQLTRIFTRTDYPATAAPDQIVLTWSDNPQSTQTIQWRTSTETESGSVRYRIGDSGPWMTTPAVTSLLEDTYLVNDSIVNRHTAVLTDLKPGTTYSYAVGDGSDAGWSKAAAFTTAPDTVEPFKFVYMGDAQNGLDTWGKLVHKAYADEPDAAFYIMAGDLVNRGVQRDDWDSFFHNAEGVYENRQLVPCIGNHEDQGDQGPWMYLELFDLPKNGPRTMTPERAYTFEYSNALFVVLDSNLPPIDQADWLEAQLAKSDATWKFVVYHHPAYSSGPDRDNLEVREIWGELFDEYHVDLALQGHDHAYLRTYPMHDEKPVASPAEGTIYIVSVSGTKFYEQGDFDYTDFGMTNVATYQVLDIVIDGDKLTYRAYDIDGAIRDEFVIEK